MSDKPNKVAVSLNVGVDDVQIDLLHEIEKSIDAALVPLGFAREGTTKEGDRTELRYWQFGVCL